MNKSALYAALLGCTLVLGAAQAADTKLNYEHSYGTKNHYHGDEVGMAHYLDNGLYVGVQIRFYNKNSHVAVDDMVSNSYSFLTGYDYAVNDRFILTPNLEARFYAGGTSGEGTTGEQGESQKQGSRYTPGLKARYLLSDSVSLQAQYRYDYRKISRNKRTDGDDDRYRQRYELGVFFKPTEAWLVGYRAYYYKGDYVMQNNQTHDYMQDLVVSYAFSANWQGNVTVEDIAASKTNDSREANLKAGFTYTF